MKKHVSLLICLLLILTTSMAQSPMEKILGNIEGNNTTLKALRKQIEAEKIGNRTGINPADPEVGLNYLWGSPEGVSNRIDYSIYQTFDFPTSYGFKKQISRLKNTQIELEFDRQKKEILTEARMLLVDLAYYSRLQEELEKRTEHFNQLRNSYQLKLDQGDATIFDLNKAELNLLKMQKSEESIQIKKLGCLTKLAGLNGGEKIEFDGSFTDFPELPDDFESWFQQAAQNNPGLTWIEMEMQVGGKEEKLASALNLPSFGAGYMSERVEGEQFQGIRFGVNIPIWENKNKVQHAKARSQALLDLQEDKKLAFYHDLKALYTKTSSLENQLKDYGEKVKSLDNTQLLAKALELGEMTLIEYILELSFYYDSIDQMLQMERELNIAKAALLKY